MKLNLRWNLSLLALGLTSGFVYLFDLANGARSEYYAAIAKSMSMSFTAFFFGSLDPASTITLDKIPGSYWLPAIFVKVFGFSTWSVNAPNAIATVALVIVVAITGRRIAKYAGKFGERYANLIGIVAGIFVAATPIVAAVARSNQPQSMFLLMLALAIDRAVVALQTSSRKQLIFAGLWIAAAFQMYMIVAWSIWPALIIAWLLVSKRTWIKKIVDLAIAGSISAFASTAWIIIVSLIPSAARPYIGGTYSNSPWEMVFGYNALGRFGSQSTEYRSFTPPFSGEAGWLRLFNTQVAGQIAWLIVPTVIAIVILLLLKKFTPSLVFLVGVFLTMFVMFSAVAGMHQFYTSAMAMPMALIIAWAIFAAMETAKHWWLLVLGLVSAGWSWWISIDYAGYFSFVPYISVLLLAGLLITVVFTIGTSNRLANLAMAWLVAGVMVLTPAVWAVDTINHPSSINPAAGDGSAAAPGGISMAGGLGSMNFGEQDTSSSVELVEYLKGRVTGEPKYLLAVFGAQSSAPIINATGASVLPIGGFDGSDSAPTLEQFKSLVATGDVQYVQISGKGGMGPGMQGQGNSSSTVSSEINAWVTSSCEVDVNYSSLYNCK
jgi:4-amino-4-deoxy-L-arabinose transferase-like glycosyltransferase